MSQIIKHLRRFSICCIISGLILITVCARAEAAQATIKIMTLNLHNGKDARQQPNFTRFIQLVATEQPDVISLQEVQTKHIKLLQIPGYQAISGPNANYAFFRFGNALLTRHKIVYHRHHYLPSQKEQRGTDEVLLNINGASLRILNTHLGLGAAEQQRQINEIVRISSYLSGPLIITGDFNLEPTSKLLTGFPLREVGTVLSGYKTYPTKQPQYQIDQIWYNPDLNPLKAQTLKWDGSDHLPVTASLVLQTNTVLPPDPVTIPDPALQHNPLLPDIGAHPVCLNLAWQKNTAAGTDQTGGSFTLPFAGHFTVRAGYDGETAQLALTAYKTWDLRDYFSLTGARGKAEWGLTGLVDSERGSSWWEWNQYYRWSNRWGSHILVTGAKDQPRWFWEQSYLPSEKMRLTFGADSDFRLRAGIAFTPDKRQIFQGEYRKIAGGALYRLGWEYRW
jgi:endonuclease/exonuclease/phosphatase family metal-dependent hydrolase